MRFATVLLFGCTVAYCNHAEYTSNGTLGAPESIDIQEVKEIVWRSIPSLNTDNSDNWIVPFKVISATRQLVAGFLYKITVLTAETTCPKSTVDLNDIRSSRCPIKLDGRLEKWLITYQEQEWMNVHNYTSSKIEDITWEDVQKHPRR